MVACLLGARPACADIYTWVDASGMVHISNLSPPESARVFSVLREKPQQLLAREDSARNAARQAELEALSDRVRELEREVESVQPPAPPQVIYVPVPAPAVVQYQQTTNPVQYQASIALPVSSECDPGWAGCWGWLASAFYPTSVVVVGAPNSHRHRADRPRRHFLAKAPARTSVPVRAGAAKSGSLHLNPWTFPLGRARSTNFYDALR